MENLVFMGFSRYLNGADGADDDSPTPCASPFFFNFSIQKNPQLLLESSMREKQLLL